MPIDLAARAAARAAALRPIAPPRLVHDVYTPGQIDSLLAAVRSGPPRNLLVTEIFTSPEEIVASSSGTVSDDAMEAFLDPYWRGDLAQHSGCYDPVIESTFYNSKFLGWARDYFGAEIAVPRNLFFNVAAPMKVSDPGHFDAPAFRGISHTNTLTWLLAVMANSQLFQHYQLDICSVVTWFWRASRHGGFTYWAEGAAGQPARIPAPMWNTGSVADNDRMFHRGESIGEKEDWGLKGLRWDSKFEPDPAGDDRWQVRNGEEVIARYQTQDLRWLFHWTALCFRDRQAFRTCFDRLDDLTHERIFDILLHDLGKEGVAVKLPGDPLQDAAFRNLLIAHYGIGSPRIYPEEAPVASRAA